MEVKAASEAIINYISQSKKKTPVKIFLKEKNPIPLSGCKIFSAGDKIIFCDWEDIKDILEAHKEDIEDIVIESSCRNTAVPMLDTKSINARIEPGAIIRDKVKIGNKAVIMMGAIINIGAVIGEGTMIDMGAVLGGRATVGKNCHIGAGAVLAGVIEPPGAKPVVIEDDVFIGANAVVLEGVHIGKGALVAAGAVVIEDVPENMVVAGVPGEIIKKKEEVLSDKAAIINALREI